jgi:hypothetical protein
MGNNNSSLAISEMAMSAKLKQSNTVQSNINCDVIGDNIIALTQTGCEGSATGTISGARQSTDAKCDAENNMLSINDQSAAQDLSQTLSQVAESATKGIAVGNSNEAETRSRTSVSGEVELDNLSSQNCRASVYGLNQIYLTQADVGGGCVGTIKDVDQSTKAQASVKCGLKSDNHQSAHQTITQTVTQSASATTQGIDPGMYVVYMYAIYTAGGVGGSWVSVQAMKAAGPVLAVAIALLLVGLLGMVGWSCQGYSEKPMAKEKVPWFIDWDTPTYYEEMRLTEKDDSNLFIVKYSKVFPLSSTTTNLREAMKKQGLMNEEYKKLYNGSDDNVGKEDPAFTAPSGNKSVHGMGEWPQPEDAKNFMIDNDTNANKYYAFEIIKYGIDENGRTTRLQKPITLFYEELNEIFWNYDKLGKEGGICIDDPKNRKICGIDQTVFLKPTSSSEKTQREDGLGGVKCDESTACAAGYFCGTGGVGCINCDYCGSDKDGYGGDRGKSCTEKCGTTGTKSLKGELDKCKICLGKILQQSETITSGKISSSIISSESHSGTYPDYSEYIEGEIKDELLMDYTGLSGDPVYGTINLRANHTSQRYFGKGEDKHERWTPTQVGFSDDSLIGVNIQSTISFSDDGHILLDEVPENNSAQEKCIYTPIEYNNKSPAAASGCPLDYSNPKKLDHMKSESLVRGGTDWSPAAGASAQPPAGCPGHGTPPTCYDIGEEKCVDQYKATCGILAAKVSSTISDGTFAPCETGTKLDSLKTLSNTDNQTCGAMALAPMSSFLSVADATIGEDAVTKWTTDCKATCCVTSTVAESTVDIQGAEGVCEYIPAKSIGINKRILPHEANTIGIRMYRDRSNMDTGTSYISTVNHIYTGIYVCIGIFIITSAVFLLKGKKARGEKSSYEGPKDE